MTEPHPPASFKQARDAARRATLAAREGVAELPAIARAEVAGQPEKTPHTADAACTRTPDTPAEDTRPDFTAFDQVVRARVDELASRLPSPQRKRPRMNERLLADLRTLRKQTQLHKTGLELVRDHFAQAPQLDDSFLAAKALYGLTSKSIAAAENDIEVLDTVIATLDRTIDLVQDGKEDEAKALFGALGDLREQLQLGAHNKQRSDDVAPNREPLPPHDRS